MFVINTSSVFIHTDEANFTFVHEKFKITKGVTKRCQKGRYNSQVDN